MGPSDFSLKLPEFNLGWKIIHFNLWVKMSICRSDRIVKLEFFFPSLWFSPSFLPTSSRLSPITRDLPEGEGVSKHVLTPDTWSQPLYIYNCCSQHVTGQHPTITDALSTLFRSQMLTDPCNCHSGWWRETFVPSHPDTRGNIAL